MRVNHSRRSAVTLTELVVAAAITISAMSMITTLAVRSVRLQQDTRHQQLVIDDLSNELEKLTGLPAGEREAAIAELAPSDYLRSALPSVAITAETIRDGDGERLMLSLNWDRPGNPQPVTLVGWLHPLADPDSAASIPAGDPSRLLAQATEETR